MKTHVISATLIILLTACDDRKSVPGHRGDSCIDMAERAIGQCMDTKGNGPVDEARARFCTEQYVAIARACRCESVPGEAEANIEPDATVPAEREHVPEFHDRRGAPPLSVKP